MDTTHTSFGQWLKERRKAQDMTQEELAVRVGCSDATIRMIELGQRRPSRQVAGLLVEHLRIPEAEQARFLAFARGSLSAHDAFATQKEATEDVEAGIQNNLPNLPNALIGRTEEVETITTLLLRDETRLLTLSGPPGIGKTSLAIEVATELLTNPNFKEGIFWVSLASVSESEMVIPAIARTLEVHDSGTVPLIDTLKYSLKSRRILLILDNFEQVVEAAPRVAYLLAGCPNLKALVTSRETLNLRIERELSVSPLALPGEGSTTGEVLAHSPAVALFVERAQAVDARFTLTAENAPLVAAICARLDGLPLAIELVAARTRMLTVKALLARLQDSQGHSHLNLLVGGARDLPNRHKTLRGAIGWSYDLLSSEERLLFRRLGVFSGGFTLSAVEAVCNSASDLDLDVFEGVSLLLNKNLLNRDTTHGESESEGEKDELRFMMLETIREYAKERLEETAESDEIHLLHAEYFLAIASALASTFVDESQRELLGRVDRHYGNLQAALAWTIERGLARLASQLGTSLAFYWELRGRYGESRGWLARIITLQSTLPDRDTDILTKRVRLLIAAGRTNVYLTDYTTANSYLEEALAISRELGSKQSIANTSGNLGIVAWLQGDYSTALAWYEEVLKLNREVGDKRRIGSALWLLGNALGEQGDFERADTLLRESVKLGREEGDIYLISGSLRDHALMLSYQGKYDEATLMLEESYALAQHGKFTVGASWLRSAMGFVVMGQGDYARAEVLFYESLDLAGKGDRQRVPNSLEGLAEVELEYARGEGDSEHLRRAATFLGAAESARRILSTKIIPVRAPVRERLISDLRSQLGDEEYEQAYAYGVSMSLEDAISYA